MLPGVGTTAHGTGGDDLVLAILRYAPLLFGVVGVVVVVWLLRERLPYELQPDVLAAVSETKALPASRIRQRPPLNYQDIDIRTLLVVLEDLRSAGVVVRWYEDVDVPGPSNTVRQERQAVYRRVSGTVARV
jgi:hypothetical protein